MYKFKINKIQVNTCNEILDINPKKINILVGPNNSGKSRFLKELRNYISGDNKDLKIINNIEYTFPKNFSEFNESYNISGKIFRDRYGTQRLKSYSNKPEPFNMTSTLESCFTQQLKTFYEDITAFFYRVITNKDKQAFLNYAGSLFYQYLGTEERLTICKEQNNCGMDSSSTNYLSSFKYKADLLKNLSERVQNLFKKNIYLDSQTLGDRLVFRISENFDYIKNYSENEASRLFHESKLDDQGDGLKSFVSTFLSLNSEENDVLLLDEPEAFLHPPLARKLGEMIGESSSENRTIFIATHSVEILKGILSKNQDVNVIRITRSEENKNTFTIVEKDILKNILENPLLRVSRVLEGIFCEKVIITEAEADELIYQELIEKLFENSGIYFAHGQNKQTLTSIAQLYQKIGVNYEIIVDFDVLRVAKEFSNFLSLMKISSEEINHFINYSNSLRKIVESSIDITGMTEEDIKKEKEKIKDKAYHKKGIRFFNRKIKLKLEKSFSFFAENHLHILKTGELETLLEEYGVNYKPKKEWIIEAINKIANLNKEDIPPTDDLYIFLQNIVKQ